MGRFWTRASGGKLAFWSVIFLEREWEGGIDGVRLGSLIMSWFFFSKVSGWEVWGFFFGGSILGGCVWRQVSEGKGRRAGFCRRLRALGRMLDS